MMTRMKKVKRRQVMLTTRTLTTRRLKPTLKPFCVTVSPPTKTTKKTKTA